VPAPSFKRLMQQPEDLEDANLDCDRANSNCGKRATA
jgi:hypothetical protein